MAPPPPITLFPPTPALKFAPDTKLQAAVKAAVDELAKARKKPQAFRLAIIDLGDENHATTMKYGAHDGDTVDFIASEAKLIALYAAFALRDMVERFAALRMMRALGQSFGAVIGGTKPKPQPDLFDALRAEIDPHILTAADGRLAHIDRAKRLPDYKAVFELRPNGTPHFTNAFRAALREMIVPSSNKDASTVIMNVGFAYISGAMKAAQLFVGGKGPWLSADFAENYYPLIHSTNDDAVGQAGTALSMAKLMSLIVTGAVAIRGDSFVHMKRLLADAVTGIDTPLLTRDPPHFVDDADTDRTKAPLRIPRDRITHIKLGQDWLKKTNGGHTVWSEAWRLKGLYKPGRVYAVSYQNLLTQFTGPPDMAFVIRRAISAYEA